MKKRGGGVRQLKKAIAMLFLLGPLLAQAAASADRPKLDAMVRIKGPSGFFVNACEESYGINWGIAAFGASGARYREAVERLIGADLGHFKEITDKFAKAAIANQLLSTVQRDGKAAGTRSVLAAAATAESEHKLDEYLERSLGLAANYAHECVEAMKKLKK